jgi:hypothetical protein
MRWPWRRKPELGSLWIMHLEAGDTVVLQLKETLDPERAAEVAATLRREFPDHKALVLHGGWELSVLRPGIPASVRAPEGLTKAEYDSAVDAWYARLPTGPCEPS